MSFEIDSFQDIPDGVSDFALIEKHRQKRKELEEAGKEAERQRARENPNATRDEYRGSHWFCTARCGTVIPKQVRYGIPKDVPIKEHQENCPYQIELRGQREPETQAQRDGHQQMRYILGMIEHQKQAIVTYQRMIQREQQEQIGDWQTAIRIIEADIKTAELTIEKEMIENHQLLNHENKIKREAAQELYDRYLKASEDQRRRDLY